MMWKAVVAAVVATLLPVAAFAADQSGFGGGMFGAQGKPGMTGRGAGMPYGAMGAMGKSSGRSRGSSRGGQGNTQAIQQMMQQQALIAQQAAEQKAKLSAEEAAKLKQRQETAAAHAREATEKNREAAKAYSAKRLSEVTGKTNPIPNKPKDK